MAQAKSCCCDMPLKSKGLNFECFTVSPTHQSRAGSDEAALLQQFRQQWGGWWCGFWGKVFFLWGVIHQSAQP